jgi:hypothetical protein
MIKADGYDTVLVATGAEPVTSRMKVDGVKAFNILEAYDKKDELGKNVVVTLLTPLLVFVGIAFNTLW